MNAIQKLAGFVRAAICRTIHTTKGRTQMKLEDLKFRYIIPLAEENERGEPGFLFDEKRLADKEQNWYGDAMAAEAELVIFADSGKLDDVLKKMQSVLNFDFPEGTDEKEKIVAVYVATERLAKKDDMQKAINVYFSAKPVDEKAATLRKHYGFPW